MRIHQPTELLKKSKAKGHYRNKCPKCGNTEGCRCPSFVIKQQGIKTTNNLCSECKK